MLRLALFSLCFGTVSLSAQTLFNGRDLAGWTMTGPGSFIVEEGLLTTNGGMGLLYYNVRPFRNSTLKVVFRTASQRGNSGIFIRLPEKPKDPWYGVHNGYEVQIDSGGDIWHRTGAIYSLSKAEGDWQQNPQGEWNTLEIRLEDKVTTISLNGKKVNTFAEGSPVPERKMWFEPIRGPRPGEGYIGVQNHDGASKVQFREITVKPN